ncbi:MAG: thioredoxin family protein [Planctomycetota bacterium]
MDRSYLSNQDVVAASRAFVCVRLLTYESADEAKVLQRLFRGRHGLENSVFAILDPSGKKRLVRAGRGPSWAFDDAGDMAVAMRRIARRYPGRDRRTGVPLLADVRRGLNAARADAQQLVVICGEGKRRDELEAAVAALAWSAPFIGKFLYARADAGTNWGVIDGSKRRPETGLVVVEPGEFGVDGEVVAVIEGSPTARALLAANAKHDAGAVDTRLLRRKGVRSGLEWEPAIPVTDRRSPRR